MSNGQITSNVLENLKAWAQSTHAKIGTNGIFVFGSLIQRDGVQFDNRSDVDLLIQIPEEKITPLERLTWIEELRLCKMELEIALMQLLKRANASEVISSIVVVTKLDIEANVHKDGAVGFFSENAFRNLLDDVEYHGLPKVGAIEQPDRLVIECLKFAQKKRNVFLAVSPNGTDLSRDFNETDPLPKDIMRFAAMARQLARPSTIPGAEIDTQRGLDYLTHFLYEFETSNEKYQALHNTVSVRRGARGIAECISPIQQLLLSEIIVDSAIRFNADALASRLRSKMISESLLPSIKGVESTVFFSDRFAHAFPGSRNIQWFDDGEEIRVRMNRLLKEPLQFAETTPIWWWRNGNLDISSFHDLGNGEYIMNSDELKITKIAAVHSGQYYRAFVYVEVAAMEPTGLYPSTVSRIVESKLEGDAFGYYWEEYGLVDGRHLITRAEYDDGAAKINGELQDIHGRNVLRCRYVTPYNFVIAAHGSPINNSNFDQTLEVILRGMLSGDATIEELVNAVGKLPKNERF